MIRLAPFLGLLLMAVATPAAGVQPDEILDDPVLEARARDISKELRCVVCQNQSIDDSNAAIARDLRLLVRERLVAGDSDEEVIDYIVARYGDYVLLRPPFQFNTLGLWLGPPLIGLIVVLIAVMAYRGYQRRQAAAGEPEPLSPRDRAALDALVRELAESAPPPKPMSPYRAELDRPFGENAPDDGDTAREDGAHEPDDGRRT